MQLKLGALKLKIRTPICDNRVSLLLGDCLTSLHKIPSDSVDSIVTDPPYGLNFMGKKWDYDIPSVEIWSECLRVLKPGGHMLASCGTRTQHRMVVNIENAGFEIRDVITHLYGQGFPKSQDISKAIDKAAGAEREVVGDNPNARKSQEDYSLDGRGGNFKATYNPITAPATPEAKQWSGWGSALKPACEFWTLCRKPLSESTIAKNVLKHGTGGLNIGGGRIGIAADDNIHSKNPHTQNNGSKNSANITLGDGASYVVPEGRFPSNLILDEEAGKLLDEQSGQNQSGGKRGKSYITEAKSMFGNVSKGGSCISDSGGASRFFYVAKASKSDRNSGLKGFITWESLDQSLVDQTASLSAQLKATLGATTLPLSDTEWSTLLFGNSATGLSLLGLTSITSTASKTITVSTTLNALVSLTTSESIQAVIKTMLCAGLNLAESVANTKTLSQISTSEKTASRLAAVHAVLLSLLPIKDAGKTENFHATVKPIKLMEYLIKLITQPNGVVLDPFMGSGTTGVAAKKLGFRFIGMEKEPEYLAIAEARIKGALCL